MRFGPPSMARRNSRVKDCYSAGHGAASGEDSESSADPPSRRRHVTNEDQGSVDIMPARRARRARRAGRATTCGATRAGADGAGASHAGRASVHAPEEHPAGGSPRARRPLIYTSGGAFFRVLADRTLGRRGSGARPIRKLVVEKDASKDNHGERVQRQQEQPYLAAQHDHKQW